MKERWVAHRSQIAWAAVLIIVLTGYSWFNGRALDRFPKLTRDDIWVMSASYNLATTGTFGSDMFQGFYDADQHYFIALPLYHLAQALSFIAFEPGIAAARAVTLVSGGVVIIGTAWLGMRWYGPATGSLAAALVAFWHSSLLGFGNGLPLTTVSTNGRYDGLALALVVISVALLDRCLTSRRVVIAFGCGVAAGLATLTQYFGGTAFVIALVALAISTWRAWFRPPLLPAMISGFALTLAPFVVWAIRHWSAFEGQASLKADRLEFLSPHFYTENLQDEWQRYRGLAGAESDLTAAAAHMFVILGALAAIVMVLRAHRLRRRADLLLCLWLSVTLLSIALLDSTNAALYAIAIWPPAVLAVAAFLIQLLKSGWEANEPELRAAAVVGVLAASVLAIAPGIHTLTQDTRAADDISPYSQLGRVLRVGVPADVVVVGSELWWWPLRDREYLSLTNLWREWEDTRADGSRSQTFTGIMTGRGATALLTDGVIWDDLDNYDPRLARQIRYWINKCAERSWRIVDPTYGELQLFLQREDGCRR